MSHFPTNFVISPRKRLLRFLCIVLGLVFVVLGFSRNLGSGSDKILWVMDNSLSMAVTDIQTGSGVMISRLDFAKQIVSSISKVSSAEQAIMSAAYGARLELPMTDNREVISDVAHGITVLSRGGGSSVSTPLETIRLIYGSTSGLHIVWITDGEFSDSGATLSGFIDTPDITFIGVGSPAGGPILEGYDAEGRPRYKESGNIRVNSIRDDTRLGLVSDSLDARLILLDSDTLPDLSYLTQDTHSSGAFSYLMGIGVLLILIGLMISRFQYNTLFFPGK